MSKEISLNDANPPVEADLPQPEMRKLDGGFSITLFKNTWTEEQLTKLALNARRVKAVLT